MTSGKATRRKRREEQTAPPSPGARRRQASPKVLLVAVGAVVLLAVIGAGIGFAVSGGDSGSSSSSVAALPNAADAQRLFRGIPQNGNVLGSPNAPVTIVEYVDLQCPFCRQFETEAMPDLVSRFVRPGKAKVEARLVAFIGPDSQRGRAAAVAAGDQDRLFDFMQLLYFNQGEENTGWLDDDMVKAAAASIPGLDASRLVAAAKSEAVKSRAEDYDSQATSDKVVGTPTILVGKSGQKLQQVVLTSATDATEVAAAIEAASGS